MADGTKIEWTDATWNPITGCSVTSPGCTNCYAMRLAGTRLAHHPSRAGLTHDVNGNHVWTGATRFNVQWLDQPLRWRKPRRIFVCAHGDLFHDSVPDAWIDRVFGVMALAPQHTFQVLTKRAVRMREYLTNQRRPRVIDLPLPNVWLGVSVEDQQHANERIPDLLATPTAVRWISAEPLLGPLDLTWITFKNERGAAEHYDALDLHLAPGEAFRDGSCTATLNWVVVGGESGTGARPMHQDWARSLRDQCAAADVPFFFKQWGEWLPLFEQPWNAIAAECWPDPAAQSPFDHVVWDGYRWEAMLGCWDDSDRWYVAPNYSEPEQELARVGKKRAGRLLDGIEHSDYPEMTHD